MSEFVALMGVCELDRVWERIRQRKLLAQRYQQNLSGTTWKALSPSDGGETGYYKQIIISPLPREKVKEELNKAHIALTGGVYFVPIHRQPLYRDQYNDLHFPIANQFAENHICPPCYPELTIDDIDLICGILKSLHS